MLRREHHALAGSIQGAMSLRSQRLLRLLSMVMYAPSSLLGDRAFEVLAGARVPEAVIFSPFWFRNLPASCSTFTLPRLGPRGRSTNGRKVTSS